MAAAGAGAGAGAGDMLRGVYEGSITGSHTEVPRRPYHKNCTCALHDGPRGGKCPQHKTTTVSYPINRSWSEGSSLVLYAAAFASPNHNHNQSPSLPNHTNLLHVHHHHHHHHHHNNDVDNDDDDDDLFGRNA